MNINSQLIKYQPTISITQVHPSSLLCITPFFLYAIPPSCMLHFLLFFQSLYSSAPSCSTFHFSLISAKHMRINLQSMEVVPSNFVGRGKGVLKGGLNDNMNAQQCQTNWEYNEVHTLIKCKEVEYIA